jgi:hypothetical protein
LPILRRQYTNAELVTIVCSCRCGLCLRMWEDDSLPTSWDHGPWENGWATIVVVGRLRVKDWKYPGQFSNYWHCNNDTAPCSYFIVYPEILIKPRVVSKTNFRSFQQLRFISLREKSVECFCNRKVHSQVHVGMIRKCKSLNLNSFIADGNQQVLVRLKAKGFTERSLDVNFNQPVFNNAVPNP